MEIDWLKCELVESVEGRCGGQPTVVGTRIFPWGIINSYELGDSIETIHEDFPSLTVSQIRDLIAFAAEQRTRMAA